MPDSASFALEVGWVEEGRVADGDLTINYFDTHGGPLTNLQITTAAALVLKMMGHPRTKIDAIFDLPKSLNISKSFHTQVFDEWISEDASRLDMVARHAMATLAYKAAHPPVTATFLEAWMEFQHVASADERELPIAKPAPEVVTRF